MIDELGIPFGNQAVALTLPDGTKTNATTMADGRVCLNLPVGSSVRVALKETHEGSQGESTTTPSGQHFRTNGTGP